MFVPSWCSFTFLFSSIQFKGFSCFPVIFGHASGLVMLVCELEFLIFECNGSKLVLEVFGLLCHLLYPYSSNLIV